MFTQTRHLLVSLGLVFGVLFTGCTIPDTTESPQADSQSQATNTGPRPSLAPQTPSGPGESVSQSNAARSAAHYLSFSAFSRSGLIKQLEFEGFSTADATTGVDATGTDWNEQAALSAAHYLSFSAFSRSGLIKQLEFEGFTAAQAVYGVGTTGL